MSRSGLASTFLAEAGPAHVGNGLAQVEKLFSDAKLAVDLYSFGEALGCVCVAFVFHDTSYGQIYPVG